MLIIYIFWIYLKKRLDHLYHYHPARGGMRKRDVKTDLFQNGQSMKFTVHDYCSWLMFKSDARDPGNSDADNAVEYEGFDPAEFRGLRDQICTTRGPKVNCLRQVDFR